MTHLSYIAGHTNKSANRDGSVRYRLYSDGTVIDQKNNNIIVGYITGEELDEIFKMNSLGARQKAIRDYLHLKN